jgi:hypothetical protein
MKKRLNSCVIIEVVFRTAYEILKGEKRAKKFFFIPLKNIPNSALSHVARTTKKAVEIMG